MEKKKLLFLTLGTGTISEDNMEAGYKETQYEIEGELYKKNGVVTKTNFVGEPIIDRLVPDEIFVLGTVKSVWHQLYATIITGDNNDKSYLKNEGYKCLHDIELKHDHKTNSEELGKLQKEITEIFKIIPEEKWEKYSKEYKENPPQIHIFLTKYGINKDELKENYGILKKVEEYLDEGIEYEVAFDITHSFRSLPIYNLIIFNYISNITRYRLSISHVYYGNLEMKRELKKQTPHGEEQIAPVVDLADLIHVLNLTNGAAEFKDTGNAVTLLEMLDKDSSLMKDDLEKFDIATQLNDFEKIKTEFWKLYNGSYESSDELYTGIQEMIHIVLNERFLQNKTNSPSDISSTDISDTDFKFLLTSWYFNQNRMGLGLATGLEALRDINTPVFMSARDLKDEERKYRESAESYFKEIAQRINDEKPKNDLEEVVRDLGANLQRYKDIRNMFAHSLSKPVSDGNDTEKIRKDVYEFKDRLMRLKKLYDQNKEQYEELFRNKKPKDAKTSSDCRIVLDFTSTCDIKKYESSNKKQYDVFCLKTNVRKGLFKNINKKPTEAAYFLYKYLKEHIPQDYEKVQIILICQKEEKEKEKECILRIFLEMLCKEDIKLCKEDTSYFKDMSISINLAEYENKYTAVEYKYAQFLGEDLEQMEEK